MYWFKEKRQKKKKKKKKKKSYISFSIEEKNIAPSALLDWTLGLLSFVCSIATSYLSLLHIPGTLFLQLSVYIGWQTHRQQQPPPPNITFKGNDNTHHCKMEGDTRLKAKMQWKRPKQIKFQYCGFCKTDLAARLFHIYYVFPQHGHLPEQFYCWFLF